VNDGESLLSPAATRGLITRFLSGATEIADQAEERLTELTDRERDVMIMVAAGRTNDEIAEQLRISPFTAKTHVNRAMAKLGAHDRAQLVIMAYETGLVRPSGRPAQ
jgi:DNA-binding NarL/FixJ family response regulator